MNFENELHELEIKLKKEKNPVEKAVIADKIRIKKEEIAKSDVITETKVIINKDNPVRADHTSRKDIRRGQIMESSNKVESVNI